jgi:hypothetical protein
MAHARLEFCRQRVLVTDDFTAKRSARWTGRVPKLVAAFPDKMMSDGSVGLILSRFVDYKSDEWTGERIGDWWIWAARESPRPTVK